MSILSVIGGVGSVAQSLINSAMQRKNIDLQNKRSMELQKYTFDQNKKMFDQANLYNSPTEQMKRFKSAGLNPNLIYSQGSSGNAPNLLPRFETPQVSSNYIPKVDLPSAISRYQDTEYKGQRNINLGTTGEILGSEKRIKEVAADSARQMTNYGLQKGFSESILKRLESVFKQEEFNSFFYRGADAPDGTSMYYLKDSAKDVFYNDLAARWLKNPTELEKNQTIISQMKIVNLMKDMDLSNLKHGLPWMNTFLQALRLLK